MHFWDTVLGVRLAEALIKFIYKNTEIGEDIERLNENLEKLTAELSKLNKN